MIGEWAGATDPSSDDAKWIGWIIEWLRKRCITNFVSFLLYIFERRLKIVHIITIKLKIGSSAMVILKNSLFHIFRLVKLRSTGRSTQMHHSLKDYSMNIGSLPIRAHLRS